MSQTASTEAIARTVALGRSPAAAPPAGACAPPMLSHCPECRATWPVAVNRPSCRINSRMKPERRFCPDCVALIEKVQERLMLEAMTYRKLAPAPKWMDRFVPSNPYRSYSPPLGSEQSPSSLCQDELSFVDNVNSIHFD